MTGDRVDAFVQSLARYNDASRQLANARESYVLALRNMASVALEVSLDVELASRRWRDDAAAKADAANRRLIDLGERP